ncbi:MAG: hypothetical protein HN577_15180, partial [Rhodospirillaceae bacterium]|nr:hypothetical protein [Rhodospirillaceae bacterium]
DLSREHATGQGHVTAGFEDGIFGHQSLRAHQVTGMINVSGLGDPGGRAIDISFETQQVTYDQHDLGTLETHATWAGQEIEANFVFGHAEGPISATLDLKTDPNASQLILHTRGDIIIREGLAFPLFPNVTVDAPAALTFALEGMLPDQLNTFPTLAGNAQLEASRIALADRFSAGPLSIGFDLEAQGLNLTLLAHDGGSIERLEIASAEDTGDDLRRALDRSFDINLPPEGFLAAATIGEDGIDLVTNLTASLTADGNLDGQIFVRTTAALAYDGAVRDFAITTLEVAASGEIVPNRIQGTVRLAADLEGDNEAFDGTASVQARLERLQLGPTEFNDVVFDMPLDIERLDGKTTGIVRPVALFEAESFAFGDRGATNLVAELPMRIEQVDNAFYLRLDDTAWLDIGSFAMPEARSVNPTSVKLLPEHLPVVVLEQFGDDWNWDVRLLIGPSAARFDLLDNGQARATVSGTFPETGIRFGNLGATHLQGTVESYGGDLVLEGPDIRIGDVRLLVNYNDGLSPWPQVSTEVRRFEDLREPARFNPAVLDISVAPVWPIGDDLRFTGNFHMEDRRYMANLEASYQPETDQFKALIRVPPVKFEPGAVQPLDLSPLYGAFFEDAEGSFEINGEITADNGEVASDLTLFIFDLSGRNGDIRVDGLNGEITLSGLNPWTTLPQQTLTAEHLDVGLPLTDLSLTMALPGDDSLRIDFASAKLAGGRIVVDPSVLQLRPDGNAMMLNVRGVDISALLEDVDIPGLAVSGRLTGHIPVRMTNGEIVIENGRLDADSAGTLRYVPTSGDVPLDLDDGNMELVLDALANFEFTELGIEVNRQAGGSTELGLHIAGANPDLYDGYPIEFNVNLSGDLDKIVRESLAGWRIPEEIRKKLSGF